MVARKLIQIQRVDTFKSRPCNLIILTFYFNYSENVGYNHQFKNTSFKLKLIKNEKKKNTNETYQLLLR